MTTERPAQRQGIERQFYAIFCCPWDAHTETVRDPDGDLDCPRCGATMDVIEAGVVSIDHAALAVAGIAATDRTGDG